jgi:hypothetical protein
MSLTLTITKRIPTSPLHLKNPLASKIIDRCGKAITPSQLVYFQGLADGLNDGADRVVVETIIKGLRYGAVFDLREDY